MECASTSLDFYFHFLPCRLSRSELVIPPDAACYNITFAFSLIPVFLPPPTPHLTCFFIHFSFVGLGKYGAPCEWLKVLNM